MIFLTRSRLHTQQVKALVNAKSVTDRIFTKTEHAQNPYQVANIGLFLDTIIQWITETEQTDLIPETQGKTK